MRMEKFKGTPGPWGVDVPDMFGDYNILHDGDALAVAAVVSNMRPAEEVAANAALVGASKDLLETLRNLYHAYVSTLESGRDRIVFLGGDCDSVERMEEGDPALVKARASLSRALGDAGER